MPEVASVGRSANRVAALVAGIAYLLIGAIGLAVSSSLPFADPVGTLLLGLLSINSLANVVHLVLGAAFVAAAVAGRTQARLATRAIGALLLVLGIAGLFLSSTESNFLAVNAAANLLHFASAATLLTVGLGTDRETTPR